MALYDRLLGFAGSKIPVHSFMAAMSEWKRGKMQLSDIAAAFTLDAGEQTEATTLFSKVVQRTEFVPLGSYNVLTNIATTYDGSNAQQGLGFVDLDMTGVTAIDLKVKVQKVGTGTQSWQLWNETDGAQLGVIDDAAAAATRTLTLSISGLALVGVKTLRMRSKSTVATDDPVYFGGSMRIHRLNTLTGVELHDVLLLGEGRVGPQYDTVAEIMARLGV